MLSTKKTTFITFLVVIAVLIYIIFIGYISYNNSQSDRFGDEVAQFVGGSYVLKGRELYKELQFNHQPLNYYFSAFVQKITSPPNLFLYISKQRLAVFGWSAMWDTLYVLLFGPAAILFILFFEILKFPYSGHKLLGETLATYPLVYITIIFIQSFIFNKVIPKWKLIITSISSFIAGFSLLPLWVVIVPMDLIILLKSKNKKQTILYLVIPFLILTGILFLFISPFRLIRETLTYNMGYFLPASAQFRPPLWRVLLFPLFAFVPPYNDMKIVVVLFLIQFIVSGYVMLRKQKMLQWVVLWGVLTLANFFRVGDSAFGSFHLLPWIGILIMSESIFIFSFMKDNKKMIRKIAMGKIAGYVLLFVFMVLSLKHYIIPKDRAQEFYVQYSESEKYGRAIDILKNEDDRLMVVPNDPLIYWVGKVDTATRLLEYYPWIYPIPEYNKEIRQVIANNPPEFFVETGLDLTLELDILMKQMLDAKYTQITFLDAPSRLYILNDKIAKISSTQWELLESMLFKKP